MTRRGIVGSEAAKARRMRVLVCGGRDYADRRAVGTVLYELSKAHALHIIQGGAEGADALAREWSLAHDLPTTTYPARWREHGKKAGALRNQQMLDEACPDLVVAFPGGLGTADMVRRAEAAGVAVRLVVS